MNTEQQREIDILNNLDGYIDKNRKGNITVKVIDQNNNIVPNAKVTITQQTHDFKFGCNLNNFNGFNNPTQNRTFQDRFKEIFNYCTVHPFYWSMYEPQPHQFSTAFSRSIVDWCVANNIQMKGHPLLYQFDPIMPDYSKHPSQQDNLEFIEHAITHHPEIKIWEVCNEFVHCPIDNVPFYFNYIRSKYPNLELSMNEVGMFYDSFAPEVYYDWQSKINSGMPVEYVGLEGHMNVNQARPIGKVLDTLEAYKTLNKPLHITEQSFPSNGNPVEDSTWRGTWTEQTQAEYVRDYYSVCFAHDSVNAISWWDLCDSTGIWRNNVGLVHGDTSPKLVHTMLKDLIKNKWWTVVTGTTGSTGEYTTRAFYGTYKVDIEINGVKSSQTIDNFKKGSTVSITMKVGTGPILTDMISNITTTASKILFVTTATAKITISSAIGLPIEGASISGKWILPNNSIKLVTLTTDKNGVASTSTTSGTGKYEFDILDVTKFTYTYNKKVSISTASITK